MATKIQRWSLDTCSCVVLESWDDSTDEAHRVHTFVAVEITCVPHSALLRNLAQYQIIGAENRRKNLVPVIAKTIRPQFQDIDYTWSFNASRQLVVTIVGLTAAQKTSLQQAADVQFGPGQVIVQ